VEKENLPLPGPPILAKGLRRYETSVPLLTEAVTRIWIEPLRHPDGLPRYNSRGQLYRARLDGPGGDVLVEQTVSPMCPSCRALMARGITGQFETWREGVPHACMRGDIEAMAGLTLEESSTKTPRFKRWQPHPHSQDAISPASGSAPARESDLGGRMIASDKVAQIRSPAG
jgi:hypothetical protein